MDPLREIVHLHSRLPPVSNVRGQDPPNRAKKAMAHIVEEHGFPTVQGFAHLKGESENLGTGYYKVLIRILCSEEL
jgi:hypothetical protein